MMKNKAINNLSYTGIVTLSLYRNNKKKPIAKVYNTGSNPLFKFLTSCLAGEFDTAKLSKPTKIALLNTTYDHDQDGNIINRSIAPASGFIYLLTTPTKSAGDVVDSSKVCYSFVISRANLSGNSFNSLGLYADDETSYENPAAFCEVELSDTSLTPSSILTVDWELIISNK